MARNPKILYGINSILGQNKCVLEAKNIKICDVKLGTHQTMKF